MLAISSIQIESAFAKTKVTYLLDSITVTSTTTSIELSWEKSGKKYQVFHEGKLLYEGPKSSFKQDNLTPETSFEYDIVSLDNVGNEEDRATVNASTTIDIATEPDKENRKKNPLRSVKVKAISNKKDQMLKFDWNDIDGVDNFDIYRDGVLLGRAEKSEFIDDNATFDKDHSYEFIAKKMIDDEQKDQIKKTLEEKNIKLSPQEEEELYYNKYSIIKNVEANKRSSNSISALATTPKVWYLMYRCFIPDKYIGNPTYNVVGAPGNQYAWFGGDNRTFTLSESESRYRTKTLVSVSIGDAGKSVGLSKNIGTSHGYDASYNLIGQKTDTDEGIYLTKVNTSVAGQISFTLYHASNNPLITGSPDIDYYYDGIFNYDQMPHHEFNIKLPGATSYTKGFHHTLVSPWYLEPPYPDAYFTISN